MAGIKKHLKLSTSDIKKLDFFEITGEVFFFYLHLGDWPREKTLNKKPLSDTTPQIAHSARPPKGTAKLVWWCWCSCLKRIRPSLH